MSFMADLLHEFDEEMVSTRRVIEGVPSDRADWKPHPKSFSLAHLAQLVAGMPGWLVIMLRKTELDLASSPGYSNQTTEALLAHFDQSVEQARTAIRDTKDGELSVPWSLKTGDNVIFTLPRQRVIRQHMNHIVHHRAQLGVYLRLLDVPVPSMYGPTADEKQFA